MALVQMPHPDTNSNKSKENSNGRHEVKHIPGGVRTEKTFGQKLKDQFIPANPKKAVEDTILETVVPAVRDSIFKICNSALSMLIYNDTDHALLSNPKNNKIGGNGYYNYGNAYYKNNQTKSHMYRNVYDYDNVWFYTRDAAEEALMELRSIIDQYDKCYVGDLYDILESPQGVNDRNFGWLDLSRASTYPGKAIDPDTGKEITAFYLNLPRAIQL